MTRQTDSTATSRLRRDVKRFTRRFRTATISFVFLAAMLFGAIGAPLLTPYNPTMPKIPERFQGPSIGHILGTDDLGRDIAARVMYGARATLAAGFASVLLAVVFGSAIGLTAGYLGGIVDNLLMRAMDVVLSFPAILLAILIVASLGTGLINLVLAIAFSLVPSFARIVRAIVLGIVTQDHILASEALGASGLHVVRAHLIPNTLPLLLVQATATMAVAISTGAALNYLGLGVEPPTPDWGLMVSEGQKHVFSAAYIPLIPGVFITLTVLSVNFIGDALRDFLDPVLKR
jgi:peptide/nickel transport system permease protein